MSNDKNIFYEFGEYRLDLSGYRLSRAGTEVPVTPKVFETLRVLVENDGKLVGKDELLRLVWPDSFVEEANLTVNISTLRKVLGAKPDGGQYIETIPKRGYRFNGDVRCIQEIEDRIGEEPPLPVVISTPSGKARRARTSSVRDAVRLRRMRRRLGLVLLGILVVAVPGALIAMKFRSARAAQRTLAILPFRNLKPDPQTDFLGFSISDSVINKLGYVAGLTVRPSSYIEKYRDAPVDPRQVAAELRVDTLLTGSYLKEGDTIRVNAQLVDTERQSILWQETIDLRYDRLLTLQDQVAQKVISELQVRLSPDEMRRINHDVPKNPVAYEFFLRGIDRYHRDTDDLEPTLALLQKAVELEPEYAPAWAYLGAVHKTIGSVRFGGKDAYDRARRALDRALALNPDQNEARMVLANLLTESNRVEEAIPILRTVVRDNPSLAVAHWELAYAYRYAGMLDESIAEGEQARRLENESVATSSVFAAYLYAGRYEQFIRSLPRRDDSAYITFYRGLGSYYMNQKDLAVVEFDRAYSLAPRMLPVRIGKALSEAIKGNKPEALRLLEEAERELDGSGVSDPEGQYKLAQGFAAVGETSAGLRWLDRSISAGFFCYPYQNGDPLLDPLRNSPEFPAIMEKARSRYEACARGLNAVRNSAALGVGAMPWRRGAGPPRG